MSIVAVVVQIIIGISGPLSLFLSLSGKRIGLWIGLLAQPFWIWSAYVSSAWGMVFVSVVYVFVWGYQLFRKKTC